MNVAARACVLVVLVFLGGAQPARADWLLTPFAGAAFRTSTGFLDLDGVASRRHATYGIALTLFPERVLGIEVESTWTPAAFTGHDLVESSRLLTGTGSLLVALPDGWSRFVRPYATIGAGVINISSIDINGIFPIDSTRPVASVGGGVWWPITGRLGVRGDVRFLRTLSDEASNWFETWHATVGATVRF